MKSKPAQHKSDYDISLDAELWARAQYWTFEEIDFLAVGIDPRKVRAIDPAAPLELQDDKRREIRGRLDVILRGREDRHELPPKEFLQVAKAASVAMPQVLTDAVEKISSGQQRARSPSQNSTSDQAISSVQYKKLLKMFLAVAVEQYGYVPGKPRQDAVMKIVRDAENMQIHLDDQTVRRRLQEAREELDAGEETGLMEYIKQTS